MTRLAGCLMLLASLVVVCPGAVAQSVSSIADKLGIRADLWQSALSARDQFSGFIENDRYLLVIDYTKPSNQKRFYVIDQQTGEGRSLLVAHGKGSDPDHDGMADLFSNRPGSKMSSLGAFVTGEIYIGRHGLSLKLKGLEASNDNALERAIVIHGADYVSPHRVRLGRSWGCPALAPAIAEELIPEIADGVFLFVGG